MASDPLTPAARRLIRDRIHSVGRLDLLVLVVDAAGRDVSATQLARQMRAPGRWAAAQAEALEAAGILSGQGSGRERTWTYDPVDAPTREAVADLVTACRSDWRAVVREVMGLRSSGSTAFSDAFRLRRPDG